MRGCSTRGSRANRPHEIVERRNAWCASACLSCLRDPLVWRDPQRVVSRGVPTPDRRKYGPIQRVSPRASSRDDGRRPRMATPRVTAASHTGARGVACPFRVSASVPAMTPRCARTPITSSTGWSPSGGPPGTSHSIAPSSMPARSASRSSSSSRCGRATRGPTTAITPSCSRGWLTTVRRVPPPASSTWTTSSPSTAPDAACSRPLRHAPRSSSPTIFRPSSSPG